MTADISRDSLRPGQKFTAVVQQQGRVPLDADQNEAADIAALMLREAVAETICAKGTPDDGFRVTGPTAANQALDFAVGAGSFWLDGARCVTADTTYRAQPDWLGFSLDNPGPALPGAAETRTDLVYLSAWEQTVTAAEDAELLERALGGADTTARKRLMGRVQVLPGVPATCAEAFSELLARSYPGGMLDPDGCAILSNTTLTIGFTQMEPLEDLCRPSAQAGFLGARNETFRIQVTQPGRFVWGRDNAAPLYRVQVAADENGARRRIVFLTLPRDEFGWPLAGMTVELLRWGALLDNHEKAAEPAGLLLRVASGFDPADNSVRISADVPPEWDQWFATPEGNAAISPRDAADASRFFFLRVWTGGGTASAVDSAMAPGSVIALGDTGLTAMFSAGGIPGDYWIVSARPNTPTQVTPWALLDGAPPAGPRRLLAPLALLPWSGPVPGAPVDCRHRFRPLCQVGGCCLVTVGDGRVSHGDVRSIQAAVALLPAEGGEICLHPGTYAEHLVIENRRNITITGCGRTTRWHGEDGRAEPLLLVRNASGIVVRRLAMIAALAESVLAESVPSAMPEGGPAMEHLLLEDLRVVASDAGAVACFGGRFLTLRRCQVTLEAMSAGLNQDAHAGRAAAFFLSGEDLTVEHCRIAAAPMEDRLRLAVGGIHIGGGSERVTIRDNTILGGNGHGITLGSVQFLPAEEGAVLTRGKGQFRSGAHLSRAQGLEYYGIGVRVDQRGCILPPFIPPAKDGEPGGTELFPESAGLVRAVVIQRNVIGDMGYSGISAHIFAGLGRNPERFGDAVAVETIDISENRITGCMLNEIGALPPLLRPFIGWGGIALSICADATIRDNVIAGNGTTTVEPIAGVFLAIAEDVRIERNRIERNGIAPEKGQTLNPGRRGGIVIGIALGGLSTYGEASQWHKAAPGREADRPALLVAGNTVDAPGARALKAIMLGPCMVLGNRFTGAGRSAFASNVFGSLVAAGLAVSRLGGQIFDPKARIDLADTIFLEVLSDVLGGDAVNLISLCVAEDLVQRGSYTNTAFAPQRLRGGEMMVNDNQISLRRHAPDMAATVSAVLLLGADDISFCNNQSEVENEVAFMLTDVLAVAASLRLANNRLQERLGAGLLSAITLAMMNETAFNQTTHCLLALGFPAGRVVPGNRSVLGFLAPAICAGLDEIAAKLSERLGKRTGLAQATIGGG
jgi:hypothetical protein